MDRVPTPPPATADSTAKRNHLPRQQHINWVLGKESSRAGAGGRGMNNEASPVACVFPRCVSRAGGCRAAPLGVFHSANTPTRRRSTALMNFRSQRSRARNKPRLISSLLQKAPLQLLFFWGDIFFFFYLMSGLATHANFSFE